MLIFLDVTFPALGSDGWTFRHFRY